MAGIQIPAPHCPYDGLDDHYGHCSCGRAIVVYEALLCDDCDVPFAVAVKPLPPPAPAPVRALRTISREEWEAFADARALGDGATHSLDDFIAD
jgi:hypothetical protein